MEFFTKANIPTSDFKINYKSCLVFIGACFADNISRQWSDRKDLWPIVANCAEHPFSQGDVFFDGEKWCCWNASSKFVGEDQSQETFIEKLNLAASTLRKTIAELLAINPIIHIVFTVSPLRHLSDGAHENNLSKATLLLAVENVCEDSSASYFPSYEIVMDELRDYRFYAEDMTHLSATAEDYIFERMQEIYCDDTTIAHTKYVEKFMKGATHRIENAGSPRTVEFARQQIAKAENLEHVIDGLDLSEEKEHFKKMFYI